MDPSLSSNALHKETNPDERVEFEVSDSESKALALDAADSLRALRDEFIIPSKADLERKSLDESVPPSSPSIYLCGNSLGLQPKCTSTFIASHLRTWAQKGVYGHFERLSDSPSDPWLDIDQAAATAMAPIVGADPSEIAVMGTLTSNLHILMASFYRPTKTRYKILIEGKAFPSDHYAVESQILHHNLSPSTALLQIPPSSTSYLSPTLIKSLISTHRDELALILLPGVQYYTGQLLPIAEITAHAREAGIMIGWDLAHAVGNVPLNLHEWDPDFAVWCSYKYLNAGPGSIAGLFVSGRHGVVEEVEEKGVEGEQRDDGMVVHGGRRFRKRLCGWWGAEKGSRFRMENSFTPTPGAAGYQLSNPSALDTISLLSSLSIFHQTTMPAIRTKSLALTTHLLSLLSTHSSPPWEILTPLSPSERGAQISIKLNPGLLEGVMRELRRRGVMVDERRPDVVRVAPVGLYNSFWDIWAFVGAWGEAVNIAGGEREGGGGQGAGEAGVGV